MTAHLLSNKWTCFNCLRTTLPIGLILQDNNIEVQTQEKPNHNKKKIRNCIPGSTNNPYIQLTFDDEPIERVTNIKFLGVILTDKLNWNDHMLYVCTKMNKSIGYFYKCRQILDQSQMVNLYKTFVEPYIKYCLPIWGGYVNCTSLNNPITKTINRFKRIMTFSKRTHVAEAKINLSTLNDYYKIELSKTANRHISKPQDSPTIYHKTIVQNTNSHDTRSLSYKNLKLPICKTNYMRNSFSYCIAATWNSLPYPVKLKDTILKFTDALERSIIEQIK